MQARGVAIGFIEYDRQEVKRDDAMQALGQLAEQRFQVPLGGNGFGNLEQRLVALLHGIVAGDERVSRAHGLRLTFKVMRAQVAANERGIGIGG